MVKLVSFDLDGTIADTLPVCIAAFKEAVTPYANHIISKADIEKTFGVSEEGMVRHIIGDGWEKALSDFYVSYEKMLPNCPSSFDGVIELIQELISKGVIVTLITGKGADFCSVTLKYLGVEKYFDSIECGSPERNIKAEAIEVMLKHYSLNADEMVYIGDAVTDVMECRKVGVRCLSAAWASTAEPEKLEAVNNGDVYYNIASLRKELI